MNLDLGLTESEEMLKKTALDFVRRDAPKEVIQDLQESDTGYTEELWRKALKNGSATPQCRDIIRDTVPTLARTDKSFGASLRYILLSHRTVRRLSP